MRILIYTPVKTASSTLAKTIANHFGMKQHWACDGFEGYLNDENCILRAHWSFIPKEVMLATDMMIMVFRSERDIVPSAFFQDCDNPIMPYAYGTKEEVLVASAADLVKHIMKFYWEAMPHINWQNTLNIGVQFENQTGKKPSVLSYDNIVSQDTLLLQNMFKVDGYSIGDVEWESDNLSSEKWYAEKLKEVKRILFF